MRFALKDVGFEADRFENREREEKICENSFFSLPNPAGGINGILFVILVAGERL